MRYNSLRISLQQATASRSKVLLQRRIHPFNRLGRSNSYRLRSSQWRAVSKSFATLASSSAVLQEEASAPNAGLAEPLHDEQVYSSINATIARYLDTKDDRKGDEVLLQLCELIVGRNHGDSDVGTRILTRVALEKPSAFYVLVRSVVRKRSREKAAEPTFDLTSGISWADAPFIELSGGKIEEENELYIQHKGSPEHDKQAFGLDISTGIEDATRTEAKLNPIVNQAVGYIFRALGSMIMKTSVDTPEAQSKVISQVMVALAIFHENGIISDSVYKFVPTTDNSLLKQPPTLHLLSNTIMSILANVAFEVRMTQTKSKPLKDLLAIHKFSTQQLGPEVWLELVLWSCLHGEWLDDGAAILRQLCESGQWSLICWKDIESASEAPVSSLTPTEWHHLRSLIGTKDLDTDPKGKRVVERTVTSELIAAYVDALVWRAEVMLSSADAGVESVLGNLESLQALLDRQRMGLGYTTWDAICLRLSDACTAGPTQDPKLTLRMLRLVRPYGQEASSVNLDDQANSQTSSSSKSYIYDASAAMLGLLHRVIDDYCRKGNVDGALRGLEAVQAYTDLNKRRSLEAFFEELKERSESIKDEDASGPTFISDLSAAHYPSYFPQIPVMTLSSLLDLVSSARLFDLGDWMLDSKDIDGPLIGRNLFTNLTMAPAVIRYATASGNRGLLSEVLAAQAETDPITMEEQLTSRAASKRKGKQRQQKQLSAFTPQILLALLDSQIQNQLWPTVETVLRLIRESPEIQWHYRSLVLLGKQMLILQSQLTTNEDSSTQNSLAQATKLFNALLTNAYGPGTDAGMKSDAASTKVLRLTVAGLFASVSPEWSHFIQTFQLLREKQTVVLAPNITYFNDVLDGVCITAGAQAGRKFWQTWCSDLPAQPAGSENYFDEQRRVVLELTGNKDGKNHEFTFQSRFAPNLSSVRIMLRQVLEERGSFDLSTSESNTRESQLDQILRWTLGKLNVLVEDADDRQRELQRLLETKDRQREIDAARAETT